MPITTFMKYFEMVLKTNLGSFDIALVLLWKHFFKIKPIIKLVKVLVHCSIWDNIDFLKIDKSLKNLFKKVSFQYSLFHSALKTK